MTQITRLDFHIRACDWKIYKGMRFFVLEFSEIKQPIVVSKDTLEENKAVLPSMKPGDPVTLLYHGGLLIAFYHKGEKVFHQNQMQIQANLKFLKTFESEEEKKTLNCLAYETGLALRTKS